MLINLNETQSAALYAAVSSHAGWKNKAFRARMPVQDNFADMMRFLVCCTMLSDQPKEMIRSIFKGLEIDIAAVHFIRFHLLPIVVVAAEKLNLVVPKNSDDSNKTKKTKAVSVADESDHLIKRSKSTMSNFLFMGSCDMDKLYDANDMEVENTAMRFIKK